MAQSLCLRSVVIMVMLSPSALGGCGDDGGDPDAGGDSAVVRPDAGIEIASPAPVTPPSAPAAPVWACPEGWREVTDDGLPTRCEPWPADGRASCTGATAHFPGEEACATVGVPCPSGPFADGLPATSVIYVDGSGSGGDGSAGDPFGSLTDAVGSSASGDTIALSKGAHTAAVALPAGVTLRGACAEMTRVSASTASDDDGIVRTAGAGVVIRDLSLVDSARPGLSANGGSAELRGVVISGTVARGVVVTGAALVTLEDVIIRGVSSRPSDGNGGQGILVEAASTATLRRVSISESQGAGISVFDPGTTVDAQDLAVHTVRGVTADGTGGSGIFGAFMTSVTAARVVVEDTRSAAVGAFSESTLVLEDAVIRETGPTDPGTSAGRFGRAFVSEGGSTATLRRAYVEDSREIGAIASGNGSTTVLEDVLVTNVQEEEASGEPGRCATAQSGGTLEARRVHFSECYGQGVVITGFRSGGVFEDTTITSVEAERGAGMFGYGLSVQSGATVTVTRVRVDGARDIGLSIVDEATVTGSDVTIRDVDSAAGSVTGGRGVEIDLASSVTLERLLVEETRELGLFVKGAGTSASLSNVTVLDTVGQEDGTRGRAISIQSGAAGAARGVLVERARGGGVVVDGDADATAFSFEDVTIRDVVTDMDNGAGFTVIGATTTIDVHRMIIERAPLAGISVGLGATFTAEDVVIDDISPDAAGAFGRGVNVQTGAQATINRLLVDRSKELGIYAGGAGAVLTLEDFVVRDTTSRTSDGKYGRGASIEMGGTLVARRGRFEESQDIGVAVIGGASATLEDVEIVDVVERSCVASSCAADGAGHGLAVLGDSTATATDFTFSSAALCGVMLARGGEADLMDGEVRASTIGACIQTEGFDLSRLMSGVAYVDNQTNLDSTSLPVPEASSPLEARTGD